MEVSFYSNAYVFFYQRTLSSMSNPRFHKGNVNEEKAEVQNHRLAELKRASEIISPTRISLPSLPILIPTPTTSLPVKLLLNLQSPSQKLLLSQVAYYRPPWTEKSL